MRLSLRLLSVLPLVALVAGCAGSHDATDKELEELRVEITRLRAGHAALTERMDHLEIDRGSFTKSPAPPPAASAAPSPGGDRPDLSVVRLSPSEGDGDADNEASRPVIRAVGGDGSIQKGDKRPNAPRPKKAPASASAPKKPDPDPYATVKP